MSSCAKENNCQAFKRENVVNYSLLYWHTSHAHYCLHFSNISLRQIESGLLSGVPLKSNVKYKFKTHQKFFYAYFNLIFCKKIDSCNNTAFHNFFHANTCGQSWFLSWLLLIYLLTGKDFHFLWRWRAFSLYWTSAADLNSLVLLPGGLLWMPY